MTIDMLFGGPLGQITIALVIRIFLGCGILIFFYLGPHSRFRNPRTTFEITTLCAPKYSTGGGVGGVPDFFGFELEI